MDGAGKQEPTLFILLGLDTLFSIKISDLFQSDEAGLIDFPIVFSHGTHKQLDESDYPLQMGLFVKDSKFHFFGGENIEDVVDANLRNHEVIDFSVELTFPDSELTYDSVIGFLFKRPTYQRNWKNKEVFSFTPHYLDRTLLRDYNSTPLPKPFGYKFRPIVVTISKKVYALGTRPFRPVAGSLQLKKDGLENQVLFEVFEPKEDDQWQGQWHWRKLDNPPDPLSSSILQDEHPRPIYHSVIKNKLFLQTDRAEYIFDTNEEEWIYNNYDINRENYVGCDIEFDPSGMNFHNFTPCNDIYASLEYKDHLLVFVDYVLVAYDLSLFKEFKGSKGSLDGYCKKILDVGNMVEKNRRSTIVAASLTLVDHNHISFVFSRGTELNVCLLEFTEPPSVKVIAKKVFDLPDVLFSDTRTLSTYLLPHYEDVLPTKEKGSKGRKELKGKIGNLVAKWEETLMK